MARIYIGGVSGSGKSSVGKLISRKDPSILPVESSELLMKSLGITDKRDFKSLPKEQLEEARREILPEFLKTHENVIMDGHFNLTPDLVRLIDIFILVEASPEKLVEFRKMDPERTDREPTEDSVKKDIASYDEKVERAEEKWGIKVIRVQNDSTLDSLADKVMTIYRDSERRGEIDQSEKRRV